MGHDASAANNACPASRKEHIMPQYTWEFYIQLPNGGGTIRDTASGSSEFDARRVIRARYPGCLITSSNRIG